MDDAPVLTPRCYTLYIIHFSLLTFTRENDRACRLGIQQSSPHNYSAMKMEAASSAEMSFMASRLRRPVLTAFLVFSFLNKAKKVFFRTYHLAYNAVKSVEGEVTFRRNLLHLSARLKTEVSKKRVRITLLDFPSTDHCCTAEGGILHNRFSVHVAFLHWAP